jgi:DnaK suppressor protein
MTATQLKDHKAALIALREELTAALSGLGESSSPVPPDNSIGRITRQDAMLSQQMALEMRRRNQARLQQIELALHRIEKGGYGVCAQCDEDISEARLRVRPEARTCIRCAEKGR